MEHPVFLFLVSCLFLKIPEGKFLEASSECREARSTALAMLRLSGERRITADRRCLSEEFLQIIMNEVKIF